MRIALVVAVPHLEGEADRWEELAHRAVPLRHARALASLGHEVHLFFDGPPRVEARGGFTVHVEACPWPGRGPARFSPHLVSAAAAVRPHVLHLHHLLAVESAVAAVRRAGCPVFAEFHGGTPPRRWARRAALAWASRRLAGVFTAAPEHLGPLLAAGALDPRTPQHVSPEICARFEGPCPRPPPGPGPRFLVVGRCEEPKDPWATVQALRCLLARRPHAEVIWATPGGADEAPVQAALRADPSLARVSFGPIARAEMAATYAWADALLVSSRREIGGTVLPEAFSQGTPVAAFELPVFRALGANCPALRRVAPRDPRALAEAALRLAERPDLRHEAHAHYLAHLAYPAVARARAALYAQAA